MEFVPVAIGTAPILVFVLIYCVVARWWRSQEGQNVVLLSVLLLLLASLSIVSRAGFPELARTLASILWCGVGAIYVWRTGLLLRAQGFIGDVERRPDPHDQPKP